MNEIIGMKGENLVFLMSMPRSGSTLLSMMLSTHTKISCPPEPWLLLFAAECFNLAGVRAAPYGRNNAQIAALDFLLGLEYEKSGILEELVINANAVSDDTKNIESIACEFVRNAYNAQLALSGKIIYIDKTPRNYTILPLIDKYFPLAKKIFLKRNPLDIALSYSATWGIQINELAGDNPTVNSRDFVEGLFILSDYFSLPDPLKYVVAYEDLVSDGSSQLAKICQFIDVDYQQSMLEFYDCHAVIQKFKNAAIGDSFASKNPKAINSNSVGRGVTGLKKSDVQSLLNLLGGNVFQALGYGDVLGIINRIGIDVPDERTAQLHRRNVLNKLHSKEIVEYDRKNLLGLQIESLTGVLRESESDRATRGEQIETLTGMLKESEADRVVRGEQIESLTAMLKESEADRTARGQQIELLTAMLKESEADRAERAKQIETPKMNRSLSTIAVDLTPVLPGGENGGAKIFVLELLRRLAKMAPQTQFVLLTQAASHEELAILDRPNMRRLMVVGPVVSNSLRPRLMGLASRISPHLPARLRGVVNRLGYKLNTALKRGGAGSLLRDMSADLLFCPFTAPTYFESGIPTVCTIYDLQYKTYPEFFAAEDVANRERTFTEACRRATALTAISDYSRDSAIAHGSIDPARIRTIHLRIAQRIAPGVEHDKSILGRLGLSPQRYLIYPANFWKHKNHEMLLTAFGMACHGSLPADIKLICTGAPGARQEWLMSAARTMNLGDRVLFPGYLPNAELAALMADCAGVVYPSLYEGFGLPVIEAMAAGVPVACSNTTSLPEVAADAAILFDPRVPTRIVQAMVSLVENEALRARLIQDGLQRAAEFSDSERMAREYWELFQYALTNKNHENHENQLTGAYADGWVGNCLNVQVAPAEREQTLKIEFSALKWQPQSHLTVQASRDGEKQGAPVVFKRGMNAVLSLPIEPTGGCYEIRIAPTFAPSLSGHGDDQRELSVMLQRCCIVRADGECIEMFPAKVSE